MFTSLFVSRACFFFFFNDTATTEIYTLSLHDALPICRHQRTRDRGGGGRGDDHGDERGQERDGRHHRRHRGRSEEHTSELQSRLHLVCRLLLEKKKNTRTRPNARSTVTPTSAALAPLC